MAGTILLVIWGCLFIYIVTWAAKEITTGAKEDDDEDTKFDPANDK